MLLLALWAGGLVLAQEAPPPGPSAAPTSEPAAAAAEEAPLAVPVVTPVEAATVTPVLAAEPPPAAPAAPPAATPAPEPAPAPAVAAPAPALAPPLPLEARGRWELDANAGFTLSAGNNNSQSLNLGVDSVYERPEDKLTLAGQYLESHSRSVSNGVVTTSLTDLRWRLGGRYDRNISPTDFGFGGLDFSHDEISQLLLRSEISTGLGRHLVKTRTDVWNVFGGLTYREDLYYPPGVVVDGAQRSRFDVIDTLFGEESNHHLTDTARFKQKFVFYPGLLSSQPTRVTLDAGLLVDINKTLSLSVKLQGRYDGAVQAPAEKYDLLFLTGLSVKFRD